MIPLHFVLAALVLTAAAFDLLYRQIPNWLVVTGAIAGFAVNTWMDGWRGAGRSLGGLAVGFGVYFILYMLRAMGGGDVKLMGAVGAVTGTEHWFTIFIFTAIIGGSIALASVIWKGAFGRVARNVVYIAGRLLRGRAPHRERADLDIAAKSAITLPHGVAIALGTLLYLAAQ